MYTIERFSCTSLPNGTTAFGWFTIIYSIITAVVCMSQAKLEALVWYTNFGVGTGYLLILAVKNRSDILLLPWLVVHAFHVVIVTPIALIMLIWNLIGEPYLLVGVLIYILLPTLLIGYGWIGIYSLYQLLKSEVEHRATLTLRSQV